MNKLLIIFCLSACTATFAKGQTLEETVKYINSKIQCCAYAEKFKKISVEVTKGGDVKWQDSDGRSFQVNLFDLFPNAPAPTEYNFQHTFKNKNGIVFYRWHAEYSICFLINSEGGSKSLPSFASETDAERVYNAVQHLRELCTKEKDPFAN